MAASHTITFQWRNAPGAALNPKVVLTDDAELLQDVPINTAVTNQLTTIAIVRSKVSMMVLLSNSTITIKTNSSGSPADTITLLPGTPLIWYVGCGYTIPLSADVTAFYISNSSGQQATLNIRVLYHS